MVRLHDAYIADSGNGAALAKWLQDKAAVTTRADPAVELAAFAEVFAKAPHPNAARLFWDFACSAEGQSIINVAGATITTHPKTRAPKAGSLAELSKSHTFSQPDYKKIIADTPKLLAEWDKYVR